MYFRLAGRAQHNECALHDFREYWFRSGWPCILMFQVVNKSNSIQPNPSIIKFTATCVLWTRKPGNYVFKGLVPFVKARMLRCFSNVITLPPPVLNCHSLIQNACCILNINLWPSQFIQNTILSVSTLWMFPFPDMSFLCVCKSL